MERKWIRILLAAGMAIVLFNGYLVYRIRQTPVQPLPRLLEAPPFRLLDSSGRQRTLADLRGKVWLANFIFTRCAGPCPLMMEKMRGIQQRLNQMQPRLPANSAHFVSISVDPGFDAPEVLSQYADKRRLDLTNWWLLTGDREETVELIREGFKVAVGAPALRASALIHGTYFLLVDTEGWVRAVFAFEEADVVEQAAAAMQRLISNPDVSESL